MSLSSSLIVCRLVVNNECVLFSKLLSFLFAVVFLRSSYSFLFKCVAKLFTYARTHNTTRRRRRKKNPKTFGTTNCFPPAHSNKNFTQSFTFFVQFTYSPTINPTKKSLNYFCRICICSRITR